MARDSDDFFLNQTFTQRPHSGFSAFIGPNVQKIIQSKLYDKKYLYMSVTDGFKNV